MGQYVSRKTPRSTATPGVKLFILHLRLEQILQHITHPIPAQGDENRLK